MQSLQSKNSRSKVRAAQIERAFFKELIWLAFLAAISIIFIPLASEAGEYSAHEAKLKKLEAQMEKAKEEIHTLAQGKQHADSASEKETLHNEMMALYKELQHFHQDYAEVKTHIRFKHPEKGDEVERKYTHQSLQPFSAFENDMSLDGRLDSFLSKMHTVYGQAPTKKKSAAAPVKADPRAPASAEKKKPFNPDDIDQPITLKK